MTLGSGGLAALVAEVAAEGLPRAVPSDATALDDVTFAALVAAVRREHIAGHLDATLESGWLRATDEQRSVALDLYESALSVDLILEKLLIETSTHLHAAAIAHRALKGPVVARTAYPHPSLRSYGDVDVLIAAERFDDAVALLEARGGHARYRQPRRNFTARFGKGVCVETDRGLEIDLHRVFVAGPFGLAIDTDDLFARHDEIRIGTTTVPAPDQSVRFLHACYHVALTSPRVTATRDVAQMACTTDLDFDEVRTIAERWRGRAVVQRALLLTRSRLPIVLPEPFTRWASEYEPDRFERAALRPYLSSSHSYAAQMATGVWALRGLRPRVEYVAALLLPDREYIREREGSYVKRWTRAIGLARGTKAVR